MDVFSVGTENSTKRNKEERILLQPIHQIRTGAELQNSALILQGTVGFVLLIACANVAGLLLAQAGAQRKELAVRSALGSGTWRIVRQVLMHSVLLFSAGGLLGLTVGWMGIRLMLSVVLPFAMETYGQPGSDLPRAVYETNIDSTVLVFTFLISLVCGLAAGIAPAIQVSRARPLDVLRDTRRNASPGVAHQRLRCIFVTAQIALAFILLVGAGLMLNGMMRTLSENIGFDPAGLLTVQVQLPDSKFRTPTGAILDSGGLGMQLDPQMRLNAERMRQNLAAVTGVSVAAGIAIYPPLSGALNMPIRIEDSTPQSEHRSQFLPILPDYFKTLQVPIVRGREFGTLDSAESEAVAIINEAMARRFWPGANPLGKQIQIQTSLFPNEPPRQIVGVVGKISQYPGQESQSQFYVPYSQLPLVHDERLSNHLRDITFVLRTPRPPPALASAIGVAIGQADSTQAIYRIRSMQQTVFGATERRRVYVTLIGIFGAIAVVLAVIGIYGVMANLVAQRTNELGIRIALGADAAQIRSFVLRQGSVLIGIGLLTGVAGSLVVTRLIRSSLFGISPTDPLTFSLGLILLGGIAFMACYVPAFRASRIDPVVALRHE